MHNLQAFLLILTIFDAYAHFSAEVAYLSEILRWNYTSFNENCYSPRGRNPCEDVRVCSFAVASHMLGGWPTYCGSVGENVPKVCCGLPLVLGKALMKRVEEEKARKRECGRRTMSPRLSPTENKFFEILHTIPLVDRNDTSRFDPPLDLNVQTMISATSYINVKTQQDFPWMVAIFKGSELLCGGTLIDRIHVLSAANCFPLQFDASEYVVRIGSISLDSGVPFSVKTVKVHEDYDALSHRNDIAVLTLDREILFSRIPHICLPDPGSELDLSGCNTTLLFWQDNKSNAPPLKILENLPVISNAECETDYARINCNSLPRISTKFICTKQESDKSSPCAPYSSGPLMYRDDSVNHPIYRSEAPWVLVGIMSFGPLCGEFSYPAVYTRISPYTKWIERNAS